jgi:hypothetical protein
MKKYITLSLLVFASSAFANEWSGNIAFESRQFTEEGLSSSQYKQYGSIAIQPEWYHKWDGGNQILTFVPFTRWDQHDEERTHSDIRELSWLKVFAESELRIGLRKVFWGVSESQHLVDIINQTDLVEGPDGEDKLGQPMINYALINDWGTLDLFVLPYFRERTFAGVNGRFRNLPHVDTKNPLYESKDKEKHLDYAARWIYGLGTLDIGVSYFKGTDRSPSFVAGVDANSAVVLRPQYNQLQQTGLDLQSTNGAWLWKIEVVNRQLTSGSYNAATAGFEYTFNGVFESSSDVGLVMEYLYDDRGLKATTPFEDDLLLALRWAKNDVDDTTLLAGVIADRDDDTRIYSFEASRRLSEHLKINLEGRIFSGIKKSTNLLYSVRQDDFAQLELVYYF